MESPIELESIVIVFFLIVCGLMYRENFVVLCCCVVFIDWTVELDGWIVEMNGGIGWLSWVVEESFIKLHVQLMVEWGTNVTAPIYLLTSQIFQGAGGRVMARSE
ncbi:hypothetical protein Hamer_G015196 [Homarus americanus]|uniref:Transmembrane protein n=1 Tax=Homarus americanus TaxID=6706 RepID=A0A8J5N8F9_HOMAM|nr:hypothetical protein Hamer_G015196 [Homarus americanus]